MDETVSVFSTFKWTDNPRRDDRLLKWFEDHPAERKIIMDFTQYHRKQHLLVDAAKDVLLQDESRRVRHLAKQERQDVKHNRIFAKWVRTRFELVWSRKYQKVIEKIGMQISVLKFEEITKAYGGQGTPRNRKLLSDIESFPYWERLHAFWRKNAHFHRLPLESGRDGDDFITTDRDFTMEIDSDEPEYSPGLSNRDRASSNESNSCSHALKNTTMGEVTSELEDLKKRLRLLQKSQAENDIKFAQLILDQDELKRRLNSVEDPELYFSRNAIRDRVNHARGLMQKIESQLSTALHPSSSHFQNSLSQIETNISKLLDVQDPPSTSRLSLTNRAMHAEIFKIHTEKNKHFPEKSELEQFKMTHSSSTPASRPVISTIEHASANSIKPTDVVFGPVLAGNYWRIASEALNDAGICDNSVVSVQEVTGRKGFVSIRFRSEVLAEKFTNHMNGSSLRGMHFRG